MIRDLHQEAHAITKEAIQDEDKLHKISELIAHIESEIGVAIDTNDLTKLGELEAQFTKLNQIEHSIVKDVLADNQHIRKLILEAKSTIEQQQNQQAA